MRFEIKTYTNPETPYITDYWAEIIADDGNLAGKRNWTLARIQDMMDDEVGIAENIQSITDFEYLRRVLGEDFLYGRGAGSPLLDVLEKNGNFNVLIMKCLEILPDYRGKSYGKKADMLLMETMKGQFGLAVKKASPLQFDEFARTYDLSWAERMKLDDLPEDKGKCTELLVKKYESWGFRRIEDTTYLTFDPGE